MEERLRQEELEKRLAQNAAENSGEDTPAGVANKQLPTKEEVKACTC